MNIKTLLTLSLLAASFNAQSAVTACPSGWTKSADGLTCVLETKITQTPNQASNTAKPVCISGYTYSSTSMKCEQNKIASQFTANKTYAYASALRFGPDPQEEDKCLNFPGTQTFQPANSYQSGGGNCACNSGFQYNGLSDNNASCNYVPQDVVIDINGTCPPGKYVDSFNYECIQYPEFDYYGYWGCDALAGVFEDNSYIYIHQTTNLLPYRFKRIDAFGPIPFYMVGSIVCK
jgi:hypothetical protein